MRIEVEGGLYHIITRGVARQDIFHDANDHARFMKLLAVLKERLPFYLYAYCLMTDHIHLLIERRTDDVGRIMQRLLTGYAQYYNRRYRRVGHVVQGRHKAILCQSDQYLTELVRYIHLNPVRAKMVRRPENYPYSSHRAYIGLEPEGIVDVDPVLRHFSPKKKVAKKRFEQHVKAGMKLGSQERFYATDRGILGGEEFVDSMIHRIGDHDVFAAAGRRKDAMTPKRCDMPALLAAVQDEFELTQEDICGPGKVSKAVEAKEVLVLCGRRLGASLAEISDSLEVNASTVSRRNDAAKSRARRDPVMSRTIASVLKRYGQQTT
jgi:REP element-mobilizing transposase RayT